MIRCFASIVACCLAAVTTLGQVCTVRNHPLETPAANYAKIQFSGQVPNSVKNRIREGASMWNNGCNGPDSYGSPNQFPVITENPPNGAYTSTVTVKYSAGSDPNNPTRCGVFEPDTITITLFRNARRGNQTINCLDAPGMLLDTAAHELGHALGLGHGRDFASSACQNHIMAPAALRTNGTYIDRQIQSSECTLVKDMNQTGSETTAWNAYCSTEGAPHHDGDYEYCSPWVVSLDRNRKPRFTTALDGVFFDLDSDGALDLVSWTRAGEPSAFLWIDRNGNGRADHGLELFGPQSPKLSGGFGASSAFEVLHEYDLLEYGGNANGYVDPGDSLFAHLRFWIDWNHNGYSESFETSSLTEAGVYALGIQGWSTHRIDSNGNWIFAEGEVYFEQPQGRFGNQAVDVFFYHAGQPVLSPSTTGNIPLGLTPRP